MEDGFKLQDATVGIIGLGLMGGSLAMGLKGKCARLIGFDSHLPTLELALSQKIVDHAEANTAKLIPNIDLLILATPVPAIISFIEKLPTLTSDPCIVMDIGSTKRDIVNAMSSLPDNFEPIGGHPICGREKLGIENADANLYQNAPFIITPLARTTKKAVSAVKQIIATIGANLIELNAEEHDRILATTSHLPFLLSSALSLSTPQEFTSLIGPGFRSTSRLAGTPPHMMMGILKSNRDHVLSAIRSFQVSLNKIESALQNENDTELESLLNQSRDLYTNIAAR